jgi:hypothetical protein
MDAKIDMLHQAGLLGSPQKRRDIVEESEESSAIEDDEVSSCRTNRRHCQLRFRVQNSLKIAMGHSTQTQADLLRLWTAKGRSKYS